VKKEESLVCYDKALHSFKVLGSKGIFLGCSETSLFFTLGCGCFGCHDTSHFLV
jgi:hypothetical protein